jgi:LysM repeat protein
VATNNTFLKLTIVELLVLLTLLGLIALPENAHAGIFSSISSFLTGAGNVSAEGVETKNTQTMPLLKATLNPEANSPTTTEVAIVSGSALLPEVGISGATSSTPDEYVSHQISLYTVREGDSVASVAKMFGVSRNTILWANNIKGGRLVVGDELIILPVSGVLHTVRSGETLKSIALKYKADASEIAGYNDLELTSKLAVGDTLTIPDGEIVTIVPPAPQKAVGASKLLMNVSTLPDLSSAFIRPLAKFVRTQGLHGLNGVDLAAPVGTPVMAAAQGVVIVSKTGGWNSGYGNYVVVSHSNGTQTLYAHLSRTAAVSGDSVSQGQIIGYVGSTGRSTGPHLHFEVRGAKNPF